jgi:hypothetical protein
MNCLETASLLETFHDGELHGREMREVALHVTQCADCEDQLAVWDRVHSLLNESTPAPSGDLSALWQGVEEGIDEVPRADSGWSGFRIAAASTNIRNLWAEKETSVGGRLGASADEAESIWLRPQESAPASGSAFLRGGMALAASLFLAIFLLGDEEPALVGTSEPTGAVARSLPPKTDALLQTASTSSFRNGKSGPSGAEVFGGTGGSVTAPAQQVQIRSLKQFGGEMAMWAEPAGETAVIWVGESAPQARR